MKFTLGMLVAAVSADNSAFLQMKTTTKRVSTKKWDDDGDDMTYGADGVSESIMDNSPTLGVHEFIEAQAEDQVDSDDADDPETALTAADDEATNFGEDADPTEAKSEYDDSDDDEDLKEEEDIDAE